MAMLGRDAVEPVGFVDAAIPVGLSMRSLTSREGLPVNVQLMVSRQAETTVLLAASVARP